MLRHFRNSSFVALCVWTLIACGLFTALSIARFRSYNVGMLDLGNIGQAIWSATQGQPLVYTSPDGNTSRLAGHVELIYFVLVPLMRLWPDAQVLLIVQAVLAASGALPVYRVACRRLPAPSALLFALGYLVFPTAVAAVLFDMHGDTLAMPLLLWMLDALDGRNWRRFWLFLGLSLLCKFYIVAPVFVLGLTLLTARTAPLDLAQLPRRRALGLAICAVTVVYAATIMLLVRPFFASAASGDTAHYARYYFGALTTLTVFDLLDRAANVLAVLLPSALLWWWSRWTMLPALAIMVPAALSTGPGSSFAWSYHHYAAAVPFIVVGSIMGAAWRVGRIAHVRLRRREARTASWLFLGASLLFHIGLNDTPLSIPFWRARLGDGLDTATYRRTDRDALKDRWLAANVPPAVPLAVSNFFAPHVIAHETLFLVRYPDQPNSARLAQQLPLVQTAVLDALFDFALQTQGGFVGGVTYDTDALRQLLEAPDWGLTAARDGLLRFDRSPAPNTVLSQQMMQVQDTAPAQASFGDALELVRGTVVVSGPQRVRATFRWRARRDLKPDEHFVAVSELAGVADARMVHLPSYALQPTSTWRVGQVWEEQFDIAVPPDVAPGRYAWRVGWYDTRSFYAAQTDERSRIGAHHMLTELELR
jgi:uncharacterized membrane protein